MTFHCRVLPESSRFGLGLQLRAREWRRKECLEILRSIVSKSDQKHAYVVTAHHADDQVETTILKLLRGAHLSKFYPV